MIFHELLDLNVIIVSVDDQRKTIRNNLEVFFKGNKQRMFDSTLYINGVVDENNKETIKKIKAFLNLSFDGLRFVVIEWIENYHDDIQNILRKLMDTYDSKCRFLYTTRNLHACTMSIVSRCYVLYGKHPECEPMNVKTSMPPDWLSLIKYVNVKEITKMADELICKDINFVYSSMSSFIAYDDAVDYNVKLKCIRSISYNIQHICQRGGERMNLISSLLHLRSALVYKESKR